MKPTKYRKPNDWKLEGFTDATFRESTVLSIFKLTVPEIKCFAMNDDETTEKKIDPAILPYLSGISEYRHRCNNYSPKYSKKLLEEFSSGGKLKMLECKPQLLVDLKPLTIDKYYGVFPADVAPVDMANLLPHKFRQIHLKIEPHQEFNFLKLRNQELMGFSSNSDVVQPSVKEIYFENEVNQRFSLLPSLWPLNFYKHVPNLKTVYYSAHKAAVDDLFSVSASPVDELLNYLDQFFKHVKQALQRGTNAQFVFALSTRALLNRNQSAKEWFEKLARSSAFAGIKCQLLSELEMSNDPDFQAHPAYKKFEWKHENTAMICCSQNVKLFLWVYEHVSSTETFDTADMRNVQDGYIELMFGL
ncbi:hypothetical protein M3Y94_00891300 [Aphelenchoides besseyi]|nr:hypothetical protein M3Y94_00891300 [Aphelenchoides besseyi]